MSDARIDFDNLGNEGSDDEKERLRRHKSAHMAIETTLDYLLKKHDSRCFDKNAETEQQREKLQKQFQALALYSSINNHESPNDDEPSTVNTESVADTLSGQPNTIPTISNSTGLAVTSLSQATSVTDKIKGIYEFLQNNYHGLTYIGRTQVNIPHFDGSKRQQEDRLNLLFALKMHAEKIAAEEEKSILKTGSIAHAKINILLAASISIATLDKQFLLDGLTDYKRYNKGRSLSGKAGVFFKVKISYTEKLITHTFSKLNEWQATLINSIRPSSLKYGNSQ